MKLLLTLIGGYQGLKHLDWLLVKIRLHKKAMTLLKYKQF